MNPENRPESRQESEIDWGLLNKSVDTIIQNQLKERISPNAFSGVYGAEEIKKDNETVERIKANFLQNPEEAQKKKFADALEIVIEQQISKDEWFGENAVIAPTSEHDDFINKVDGIVEFYTDGESDDRIALVLDASLGDKSLSTKKKIDINIRRMLGKNSPAQVKYFESQTTPYKGRLARIIPIVVGLDGKHSGELFALFGAVIESKEAERLPEGHLEAKKEELRMHPAQMVFLEQTHEQLTMYERLLENNPESSYTIEEVQKTRLIIENIIASKKDAGLKGIEDDGVLNIIRFEAAQAGRPS